MLGAPIARIGRDYGYTTGDTQWEYRGPGGARHGLPHPALRGAIQLVNAATAIAALDLLRERVHVGAGAIRDGLVAVELPGRFQVLPGRPTIVLDVAHNPQAARVFAAALGTMGYHPRTTAVFGMLADKDIAGVVRAIVTRVDRWHVAACPVRAVRAPSRCAQRWRARVSSRRRSARTTRRRGVRQRSGGCG